VNVVKIQKGGPPPIGRIVSTRRTIPSLLERLTHFHANWAVLLDFSNCIFSRCRCRREDKNCLSSGASFAYLHRPFASPPFVLQSSGTFFSGVLDCGSSLAAIANKAMFFQNTRCNLQYCGRSTAMYCVMFAVRKWS